MTNHLPIEDLSVTDWCLKCGHYHFSKYYRDETKTRHCASEGCRCMKKDFVPKRFNGKV